ncbi:hypothetical protein [Paenimyroides aestuarii]|uniref:Uncharacterized protein n=1 Tax=Paenimyroides aestuarii TaxID=2968490 RepID=A0ABY5NU49_9FLAO|nr:hypothetical protein [Paenimyroides aestuarii]UUV22089.1 hypothetical protein NPX36_03330 [Paenimyroides aestuarii]
MANRTYLFYQNKENEWREFEYATIIPSLWQELYNIELIEAQKNKIIEAFTKNEYNGEDEERKANLKVTKENAIKNLQSKINLNESSDKKQLRLEFIKFIQSEVLNNSTIELSIEEISWFCNQQEDIFIELEKFHTDTQTQKEFHTEKVTFQTIGFNNDFEPFSSVYKKINLEQKAINKKNDEKHQIVIEQAQRKERKSKLFDLITMSLIASVCTFFGFLGFL